MSRRFVDIFRTRGTRVAPLPLGAAAAPEAPLGAAAAPEAMDFLPPLVDQNDGISLQDPLTGVPLSEQELAVRRAERDTARALPMMSDDEVDELLNRILEGVEYDGTAVANYILGNALRDYPRSARKIRAAIQNRSNMFPAGLSTMEAPMRGGKSRRARRQRKKRRAGTRRVARRRRR